LEKHANTTLAIVAGLVFFGCHTTELAAQKVPAIGEATLQRVTPAIGAPRLQHRAIADDTKTSQSSKSEPKTYFLIVGKATIADPAKTQEIAATAVRKLADAARSTHPTIVVDALAEAVMTKEQYRRGEAKEKVTGTIFKKRLEWLANTTTLPDTVVIYTHSHGRRGGFEDSQPLGGIVMDLPVRQPEHRGAFLWDEYIELLLKIPAKSVVVLTMSCFSGGFVEYLNSPKVRDRWKNRRQKQGRSLIFLTSQRKDLRAGPIMKDGEVINPFTYAVAKTLSGEADGFKLVYGKPAKPRHKDRQLTVGEMIDYILYTTENTISEQTRLKNTAKPQLTGSFERGDVLSFGVVASTDGRMEESTSQQDAPADADKPRR